MSLILSFLLALPAPVVPDADSACEQASYLLCHRHLNQKWFDSARTIVVGVRQREPENQTALCLWARILLQLGDDAPGGAEKKAWYAKARAVADTLRRQSPLNPNGHMWWATAQGKLGQRNGILSSVGMIGDLKREFGRALELDSNHALAWYALGRLYSALPAVLGGSLNLAEDRLRRGLAADSNYTLIRLELARVYLRQRRRAEARHELHVLLATGQPTDPAEFTLSDQPAAVELLNSIEAADKQSPGS